MISQRQRFASAFSLHRISGLYLLLIIVVTFGIWVPNLFLTQGTLDSILSSQAVIAIVALGALAPLSAGAIDISGGANANLAAVIVTILQTEHNWSMWAAIGFAILVSLTIGAGNGILVVKFGINPIITTLAMTSIVTAIQTILVGANQPFPVSNPNFGRLTQASFFNIQAIVLYLIVIALVMWWLLEYTPVGRYLRAIGANAEASRLSGIKVGKWIFISFLISGVIYGLGGVLYVSQVGPSLTFGQSFVLPALAACFLGSTQIRPGTFNVWGTLIAIYVLAAGVKGLQLVTGAPWLADMFNGIALLLAVGFAVWQQKRNLEARRKGAGSQASDEPIDQPGDPEVKPAS